MRSLSPQNLSFTGGRLIDPFNKRDQMLDVHVSGGKIAGLGQAPHGFHAERCIDATGLVIAPGIIDLSVRTGEPGFEQKGTIASESAAAVKGGITHLCCPPDSDPIVDSPAVVQLILDRMEMSGSCRISPIGALTRGLEGEQLSEMAALKQAGCVAVSNSWYPVKNNQTLRRCMEYAATFGFTLFVNAQDASLSAGTCAHEGAVATRLGLPSAPEAAETIAVVTHIILAEQVGTRLHFSQISTAASVKLIAEAQQRGVKVSADVAIHQLLLTEEQIDHYNGLYHCQPPLRSKRDREGLRQGVAEGTIQAICSDHRPHEHAAKSKPFAETEPGISGLETLLPLSLALVEEGVLDLPTALQRLCCGPAEVLKINHQGLSENSSADLIVFNPQKNWTVTEDSLVSVGKNSPFVGQHMRGEVSATLVEGRIRYEA